jgi:hypothetical protein
MLNNLYAGWTFNFMPSNNGFMVVENSPAYVQFYGAPYNSTVAERIGAKLELNFLQPAGSDFSNFHWIQRVTNFKIYGNKGSDTDFIDVPDSQNNPFYDLQFNPPLTPGLFIDTPYTTNIWQAHTFDAELYVVELTVTRIVGDKVLGDVTIYNGVSWGWTSTFTPRKASDYPGDDGGCNASSGGGGCESASISFAAVRQMLLLDSDGANTENINNTDGSINRQLPGASQSPKSVPEPGSIVGLLALGIWSVRSLTKRKSGEPE